jgi:hypothetical protein
VTCPLKAGIAEPEEMAIARECLGKHTTAVINMHTTIEELEALFSVWSMPRLYPRYQT